MPTIRKGMRELQQGVSLPLDRIRRSGAGRKPLVDKDASLLSDLTALLKARSAHAPLQWVVQQAIHHLKTQRRHSYVIRTWVAQRHQQATLAGWWHQMSLCAQSVLNQRANPIRGV